MTFGMLKAFAFLVTMSLVSGCAIRGEYRGVAYAIDGTMIAAGAALALADEPGENSPDEATATVEQIVAWPLLAMNEVGVGMMAVGTIAALVNYGINAGGKDEATAAPAPAVRVADERMAPLPELPGSHPDAVRLTQQARVAALGGNCSVVRRTADRVFEIDERYYVRVFSVDPPLHACM